MREHACRGCVDGFVASGGADTDANQDITESIPENQEEADQRREEITNDGVDNDDDGEVDEEDEADLIPAPEGSGASILTSAAAAFAAVCAIIAA